MSVRIYLILISFVLFTPLSPSLAQVQESEQGIQKEYSLLMKAKGQEFTALFIFNNMNEDKIVGTTINEFGLKVFDFSFDKGKTKVCNVIAPLNKWYIRKILRKDIGVILKNINAVPYDNSVPDKKYIIRKENGTDLIVENRRYNISYTLTYLKTEE